MADRRGRRLYDRWAAAGPAYRLVDAATCGLRREAVAELDLAAGATAVDLGCGPGASLPLLADAVGADGRVVGVDYSAGMVRRAADRTSARQCSVIRADAARLPFAEDAVDGVLASLALSAMVDLEGVLDELDRVVRPGGHLVVLDARLPDGTLGDVLGRAYRRIANVRTPDVLAALRARDRPVDVRREFDAGLGVLARVDY